MILRILGPMDTGGPVPSPRERAILSALIVRRESAVSSAELADACWGEHPPATWAQQVRNSVAKIRARLGAEAVQTVGVDYRLGIDADAIDAVQFERIVSDARRHALQGAHDRAIAGYRRALDLWRGAPLPDVASWTPGAIEAMRLLEIRKGVEEDLLDARLRAGEHREVIPDAERLVREEPLREHRWAILALANYRADRQAEAMAVLRAARTRLAEELGIDPGRSLVDLETGMLRHDPALDAPAPFSPAGSGAEASCPYRGLAAYGVDDRALFFGRDADADDLTGRCLPRAVVTLIGASGSGKSSLLRAGVIPRLRDQGRTVTLITPHAAGVEQLAAAIEGDSAVVCVDQAEELLMLSDGTPESLGTRIAEWVDEGGCLVLTLRSDFLDRATAVPGIGARLGRGLYALSPLDALGLREAVVGPARESGLRMEPGLVELILRDAGDRPGILPALSHSLVATWARRDGATLTVDGYEASGGIAGAIAQSAEHVYSRLSPAAQDVCRSLMMRLMERTPDGITVRRRVPLDTLTADPERRSVVEGLVAARLVTIDGDSAMIAHESVGTTWPRLDGWLTEDASNARVLRQVESAAAGWDAAGRPDDDLLRGGRLHGAIEWRDSTRPDLTTVETAFLDASLARHADEMRELAARAARERARNRWLRSALGAAAVLLVVALVAAGVAAVQRGQARAAAEDAAIEAIAATSLAIRDSDRDVAALLAAELQRRWPDDSRSRSALLGNLTGADGLVMRLSLGDESRVSGAVIPGTRTALIVEDRLTDSATAEQASDPASVRVIDLDTGETIRELDVRLPPVDFRFERDVVVSADGTTAFIQSGAMRREGEFSCCMNHLDAIDLTTGRLRFETVLLDDRTGQHPVLTPDGSRAYFSHSITADPGWVDLATGEVVRAVEHDPEEFEGLDLRTNGLALVGDRLYASGDDGVTAYDAATLDVVGTLGEIPGGMGNLLLLPDGDGGLVAAGDDGALRVDLATGETLWRRGADEIRCVDGAMAPPDRLVCASGVGTIRAFDLATGRPTTAELDTLSDWNRGVDILSETGEFVTLTSRSPAALLRWRLDGMPAISRPIASGQVVLQGFGADDSLLITADAPSPDGEFGPMRLWDIAADAEVGEAAGELAWVAPSVVLRRDTPETAVMLHDLGSGTTRPLDLPPDAEPGWWVDGGGMGPHAFVIMHEGLLPFDPHTGETGTLIEPDVDPLEYGIASSELGDTGRVAFTWWDDPLGRTITAVYDLDSGEEVARGLENDSGVVGMPNGDLLSASSSRLMRSTSDLEPVHALAKTGVGPMHMAVSDDGAILLTAGWDQRVTLYDLRDSRRLGDEIAMQPDPTQSWPAGFLSADGLSMATNATDGVLVWDLRPEALREAACRMVGREFTRLEWRTYFGDEPYFETCSDTLGSVETRG
ncbi:nSTAND1 domain-containing NTPase [Agromyces sp. ZXT2-6]|uniref:nSTAND1 domain-containing NTPase n=1 Tax=Agromyces sp. ZXT2-6 TaxID=3461153 RepID=UPI0040552BB1